MMTKKKQQKAPERRVEVQVHLPITQAEQLARSKRANQLLKQKDRLELERKDVAKQYRDRISSLVTEAQKLLEEAETEMELKTVKAVERRNFNTNRVEYWFKGKLVKTRDLTIADRQEEMNFQAPKKTKEQKAQENAKACAPGAARKPSRGQRQPTVTVTAQAKAEDIANAIREQTSRKTANSAVDGVAGNAVSPTQ